MNTEKYAISQLSGLLAEAIPTRPMYKDRTGQLKDTVSKSNIDFTKTEQNYNLCSHDPYTTKQMKEMYTRITGRTVRKDAKWGGTVLTLPKELKNEPEDVKRAFFEASYKILRDDIYKIKEEDVIIGAVHMDETTPHMHFYYIPHHYGENGKETVSWDKCMTRSVYQTQHTKLQKALNNLKITDKEIKILNGETQGINVKLINQAQRKEYAQLTQKIEEQKKEIEALKQEAITRTFLLEDLKKDNKKVNDELTNTQKELSDAQIRLTTAQDELKDIQKEKTLLEAVKRQIEDLWAKFHKWTQEILPKLELDIQREQNPQRKEGRKTFMLRSKKHLRTLSDAVMEKNLGKAQQIAETLDADYQDYQDEYER